MNNHDATNWASEMCEKTRAACSKLLEEMRQQYEKDIKACQEECEQRIAFWKQEREESNRRWIEYLEKQSNSTLPTMLIGLGFMIAGSVLGWVIAIAISQLGG